MIDRELFDQVLRERNKDIMEAFEKASQRINTFHIATHCQCCLCETSVLYDDATRNEVTYESFCSEACKKRYKELELFI